MNRKFVIAVLVILILPIIAIAVNGAWIKSEHDTPAEEEYWTQYRINMKLSDMDDNDAGAASGSGEPCADGDIIELEPTEWIVWSVPSSTISHGLYRAVMVLAVYNTNTEVSCAATPNINFYQSKCAAGGWIKYYYEDPLPAAPLGADDAGFNEVMFYPYDFGLVYIQDETDNSKNSFYFENYGAGNIEIWLDEFILTPA